MWYDFPMNNNLFLKILIVLLVPGAFVSGITVNNYLKDQSAKAEVVVPTPTSTPIPSPLPTITPLPSPTNAPLPVIKKTNTLLQSRLDELDKKIEAIKNFMKYRNEQYKKDMADTEPPFVDPQTIINQYDSDMKQAQIKLDAANAERTQILIHSNN